MLSGLEIGSLTRSQDCFRNGQGGYPPNNSLELIALKALVVLLHLGLVMNPTLRCQACYLGYFGQPKSVTMTNHGIVMEFVLKRSKFIEWDCIRVVKVLPPDPPEWLQQPVIKAGIMLNSGKKYAMSREIGANIQEAYYMNTGRKVPDSLKD